MYGVLRLGGFDGSLLLCLGEGIAGASCMNALVLAQLHFGTQSKLHLKLQSLGFTGLEDGDHRLGCHGQTGFGNGLGIVLGKHVLHSLPQ